MGGVSGISLNIKKTKMETPMSIKMRWNKRLEMNRANNFYTNSLERTSKNESPIPLFGKRLCRIQRDTTSASTRNRRSESTLDHDYNTSLKGGGFSYFSFQTI